MNVVNKKSYRDIILWYYDEGEFLLAASRMCLSRSDQKTRRSMNLIDTKVRKVYGNGRSILGILFASIKAGVSYGTYSFTYRMR